MLNQINHIFAEEGINIAAQYLQTSIDIGYVVIDIETDHAEQALEYMKQIDGTIWTRMLF